MENHEIGITLHFLFEQNSQDFMRCFHGSYDTNNDKLCEVLRMRINELCIHGVRFRLRVILIKGTLSDC